MALVKAAVALLDTLQTPTKPCSFCGILLGAWCLAHLDTVPQVRPILFLSPRMEETTQLTVLHLISQQSIECRWTPTPISLGPYVMSPTAPDWSMLPPLMTPPPDQWPPCCSQAAGRPHVTFSHNSSKPNPPRPNHSPARSMPIVGCVVPRV